MFTSKVQFSYALLQDHLKVLNFVSNKKYPLCPVAENLNSALVSAGSKAKMSDLTESLAPKSIQTALPTESNFCWRKDFSLTVSLLQDTQKEYDEFP